MAELLCFLEERKAIERKISELEAVFSDAGMLTRFEASIAVICMHMEAVSHKFSTYICDSAVQVKRQYMQSVHYIEHMLREQLIAAIGKQVTPDDFAEYMRFHNNKLFNENFKPKPCCYSIRRTEMHSPQGIVSIERKPDHGDTIAEPISTIVHRSEASAEMKVPGFPDGVILTEHPHR